MVEENLEEEKSSVPNVISAQTGELDVRFQLWRSFCAENGVPIESLPSDLIEELRERWEKLKDDHIHKPLEGR